MHFPEVADSHVIKDNLRRTPRMKKFERALFRRTIAHPLAEPEYPYDPFDDGQVLQVGSVSVRVLHTPGHRPEHCAFVVDERLVLTGDSLFVGDAARPDLAVDARQRVDVTLQVGHVEEFVKVTDAAALLETDTSSRGQLINPQQIVELPLNGRSYADLTLLTPGVAKSPLENGTDSSRDAAYHVNGGRSELNNFLLDGIDNNAYGTSNQRFSNQVIQPNPDALAEFKVEC